MGSFKSFVFATILIFGFVVNFTYSHEGHDHEPEPKEHNEDPMWSNSKSISMKKETGVDLRWIDKDEEDWITMEMRSATTGYVSVGFCAIWHGSMKGCDIIIGWVDQGTAFVKDYHAEDNGTPIEDSQQDCTIVSGKEDESGTTIVFKRKWNTDDAENDVDLEHNAAHVIYAWHPQDPKDGKIPPHDRNTRGHTLYAVNFTSEDHHHHHLTSSATNIFEFVYDGLIIAFITAFLHIVV